MYKKIAVLVLILFIGLKFSLINAAVLPAPNLNLPANNAIFEDSNQRQITLSWSEVNGAKIYEYFLYYANGDYASHGVDYGNRQANEFDLANGKYTWTVRACFVDDIELDGNNDANCGTWAAPWTFTVRKNIPTVQITAPKNNDVLYTGQTYEIKWTTTSPLAGNYLNLILTNINSGTWQDIATGISNTGSYIWTIPATLTPDEYEISAGCRSNNEGVSCYTEWNPPHITIRNSGIILLSPNYGENIKAGQPYNITWRNIGNTPMIKEIRLFNNNSQLIQYITRNITNTGSYIWTPSTALKAGQYKLNIWSGIINITDTSENYFNIINAKSLSGKCPLDNTLIQYANNSKVYIIIKQKKVWIPTLEAFNALGFDWRQISQINANEFKNCPTANLIRVIGDSNIYYVNDLGMKKYILNPQVFSSYKNKWNDVLEIYPDILHNYPDVQFIKYSGKIYKLENGQKRLVKNLNLFSKDDINKAATVNKTEFNAWPSGASIL